MAEELNLDEQLAERGREEAELQFKSFTNETALELGLLILETARQERKLVTIDIERHGQQLFHYAMEGTTPDNDQWIIRKKNVVKRFNKSSYHVGLLLANSGKSIEERYFLDPLQYSAHGGSFPLIIKDVGIVGAISVSGLPQEEDHRLVVKVIREYLQSFNPTALQ
ncbi:MAG: heme-degrading domain-containing protein [Bacteroidota bacterium]